MTRAVQDKELIATLADFHQRVEVLFRCVNGPSRAYVFGGMISSGEIGRYHSIALAAELNNGDDENRYGLLLLESLEFGFQDLWNRGARTIAWRQHFQLTIFEGGDRAPDLLKVYGRLCAFNANGVSIPPGTFWEKPEGDPVRVLTREQLEDRKL